MKTVQKILEQYDISESGPVKVLRESDDNSVYLIGEKNKKILRISKRLHIEDVRFEYEALQHLGENKFPVPDWIKTKNRDFYASTKNVEVAVVFDFIEGYQVKIDKENLPSDEQAFTAGRILGSLDEIGRSFKSPLPRKRNIFTELERVIQNQDVLRRDFEGGDVFVEQVKQAIEFGKKSGSSMGLTHNDYRVGNVFFKNDNEINGVIDFDWSCIGPTMKDLALGVLEWSFPDGKTSPDFGIFDTFLEGYNSSSATKYIKNRELYSWIMFAALSDASTFFCDRLSNPESKKRITCSYMYQKYLYFSKVCPLLCPKGK